MTRETKVGLFVVGSIVLVLILSALMGNLHLFGSRGLQVTFLATDSSGITANSKVKYRGITVGKVNKIEIDSGKVAIRASITDEIKIPDNVTVMISQDGLMGEKFIDLNTKSTLPAIGYLVDGGVYNNFKSTMTMDDLAEKVQDIAGQVSILTSALNSTFASEQGKEDMAAILRNLRLSTDRLNNILATNQDEINSIIRNINRMSATVDNITSKRERDLDEIVTNIHEMTASLNKFSKGLDRIMASEESDIQASLKNLKELTDEAKISIDNINKITQDAHDGKGTIGMLLADNETRDQLKDAVNSIHTMMTRADQLVLKLEAGLEYLPANDDYHGTFTVKLQPSSKRYYLFGISNKLYNSSTTYTEYTVTDYVNPADDQHYTEEKTKTQENVLAFSLQYALMFERYLGVRGGMFENTLGFGVDLYPLGNDNLSLTFEISDFLREPGGPYMKVNAKYYFLDHLFVQAGWDDFNSGRSSFSFGGGIHLIDDDLKYVIGSIPISSVAK